MLTVIVLAFCAAVLLAGAAGPAQLRPEAPRQSAARKFRLALSTRRHEAMQRGDCGDFKL
jgi:hypothetical protein